MNKLPPLPKEAFDGENETHQLKFKKCLHEFVRKTATAVKCKHCPNEWIDNGVIWPIK